MRKVLITLVALAVGMTAFAQYGPGRPGGGRGGYGYGHNYGSGGYRPSRYYMDGAFEVGIMLARPGTRSGRTSWVSSGNIG